MRRGSTKSLTFSVYRGQQITKDRVDSVRNPQTSGQMDQRLKLPLVANARAVLKELVNHSFEGVPYGDESLRTFSQENLRTGNLNIVEYVPKGGMDCGLANFLISRGSIDPIAFNASTKDGADSEVLDQAQEAIKFGDLRVTLPSSFINSNGSGEDPLSESPNLLSYLAERLKLDPQAQLTFLLLRPGYEYEYDQSSDKKGVAHYHRFVISRLKFGDDLNDTNAPWEIKKVEQSDSLVTLCTITDGYITLNIYPPSADNSQRGFITLSLFDSPAFSQLPQDQTTLEAAAIITSLQSSDGNWRRSTQRLTLLKNSGHPTYEEALYSYLGKKAQSTKYLNSGTEGVGITGGKG